jgi:hypothetical protein
LSQPRVEELKIKLVVKRVPIAAKDLFTTFLKEDEQSVDKSGARVR